MLTTTFETSDFGFQSTVSQETQVQLLDIDKIFRRTGREKGAAVVRPVGRERDGAIEPICKERDKTSLLVDGEIP